MKTRLVITSALLVLSLLSAARAAELPGPVVPDGLGVNIHFTDAKPGEMEMLAGAGFRIIRMDLSWGGTEREKGKYDFSAFDRLMASLKPHGIRALLILDYSNRHYDQGLSPHSDEGRRAFAAWAAAAVKHFRGQGILWEMYNEPNIHFWKPEPNVENYIKLALEVGKAIREVSPDEIYIGPATSQIDMTFLEACFKAGLLEYWHAVTVHPYRQTAPETVSDEYARLRRLIDQYAPQGKKIPILSAEWGYSSVWQGMDDVKQGKMLPRQWLTNLAHDIPVSIWYDWHDDGRDPKEAEHHFGTVQNQYFADRKPAYDPKPSYRAAQTLTSVLKGFTFSKRLDLGRAEDYAYLFAKGNDVRLAAWTTSTKPRQAMIPASPGRFAVTGHTGEKLPALTADEKGLAITLTDAPQYLVPEGPNALLQVAAAWQKTPTHAALRAEGSASAKASLALRNPLDRPIRVSSGKEAAQTVAPGETMKLPQAFDLQRSSEPVDVRFTCRIEGLGELAQTTRVTVTNPLRVVLGPATASSLPIRVENPSGEAFDGVVRLTDVQGLRVKQPSAAVSFAAGEKEKDVVLPIQELKGSFRFGLRVENRQGQLQVAVPVRSMTLVDDFSRYTPQQLAAAYRLLPDGDAKVGSEQSMAIADAPPGLPGGVAKALKIAYRMDEGWKFLRLAPQDKALVKIEGQPQKLGLWVYSDGSGNSPRLRFSDATGQVHQPTSDALKWTGWRYIEFTLDGQSNGHWGGANDGSVHHPIRWDTLFLLDGMRKSTKGEIYLAAPMLVQ